MFDLDVGGDLHPLDAQVPLGDRLVGRHDLQPRAQRGGQPDGPGDGRPRRVGPVRADEDGLEHAASGQAGDRDDDPGDDEHDDQYLGPEDYARHLHTHTKAIVSTMPEPVSPALKAVSDAVLAVASRLSVDEVLQQLVDCARELVEARYAALGIPDGAGGFRRFLVAGMSDELVAAMGPLPRTHGMLGAMLGDRRRLPHRRHPPDPRFRAGGRGRIRTCGRSWACRSSRPRA